MTLARAVSAATRMAGRENARYINVGFRCAKTLWPLASSAEGKVEIPREVKAQRQDRLLPDRSIPAPASDPLRAASS